MRFSRIKRTVIVLSVLTAIGAIVGTLYGTIILGSDTPIVGATIGAAILASISLFEVFYVRQPRGEWLRRSSLIVFVGVSALVWLVLIGLSLSIIPSLLGLDSDREALRLTQATFTTDLLFSGSATLVLNTVMRLRTLVGGRVLINFLSGRYRHPIEEERIFFFLDLIGSTTIAEQLGSVRYHSFLRDFIEAIEMPISDYGGEIYQYVGDEVVATWPVRGTQSNGRAVACYFAMIETLARQKEYFERKYKVVPTFGAGIHCGEVVAGEIGDQRRQIVFVGDAVNTAARIEAQARSQGRGLMVSQTLLSRVALPVGSQARNLGMIALKGKAEPVELFEIFAPKEVVPAVPI